MQKIKRRENKNSSLRKLLFKFLFFSFVGVCVWALFFSDYTRIKNIEIQTNIADKKALLDIADELKNKNNFRFLSGNNFFVFPRKKFANLAKEQFKIIKKVKFNDSFPSSISIEIIERKGIEIFCSREECFLLDDEGIIFYELQPGEKDERFRDLEIISDNSYPDIYLNLKVEDNNLVIFIDELKKYLKESMQIEIERQLETPSLVSGEIRIKTNKGWQIYFNLENDVVDQVKILKEVLGTVEKDKKNNLNYIDLRIKDKAIYNTH